MLSDQPEAADLINRWLERASDHAAVVLDPSGVIIGWLAGAEVILGYSAAEAMGRHIALIFTEDDRAKGFPDYELKVAARDNHSEDSRWHARRDGTRIWVSGTMSAVRGAGGEVLGFVKLMRDQTDQRAHLERFENQVTQLGEAREQTHRFLKTLGHELRNPLGVLGNTHQILARLAADERTRKAVDQFGEQLAVVRRLADDLMDVTRLEQGKVELALERTDMRVLLEGAAASFRSAAAARSIELGTLLPPSPLWVDVDRARMQQVVLNLLGNAVKYTPAGGSVWVKASQEADEVVIWVQDTGIGIFPPLLPRIFDLFTQAPEAQSMREGGIGVGLALVRQLVELHGGSVQAKSPGLGKGSEFSVRLPAVADFG